MIHAEVKGLPDVREALHSLAPKLRVRALRNALAAGARIIQRAARNATPVLKLTTRSGSAAYRKGYRKLGTVRRAISVRTSKLSRRQGNVGVFVNVRPAKGAARGAKNWRDPFYWRWLNFGWNPAGRDRSSAGKLKRLRLNQAGVAKAKEGAHFLEAGARMLAAARDEFVRRLGPIIAKLNTPKAPTP